VTERPARADRFLDPLQVYAEADAETRSVIEKELDRIDALDHREIDLNTRGLNYGILVTLAFLAACVYLILVGHGVEGTILGVIFILALMAVLARGRKQ
jgi:hypothetical protein